MKSPWNQPTSQKPKFELVWSLRSKYLFRQINWQDLCPVTTPLSTEISDCLQFIEYLTTSKSSDMNM